MVFEFFRAHGQKSMRLKLILLYVLNIYDIFMTYQLLQTGCFFEANYLLARVMVNPVNLLFLKVLLPAILIVWLYARIRYATEKQLRKGNVAVNLVLLLYIFVSILHFIGATCFLMLVYSP